MPTKDSPNSADTVVCQKESSDYTPSDSVHLLGDLMFTSFAKPKTPMFCLKQQLNQFKSLNFVDFVMLNRQGATYKNPLGTKPNSFDCIYLFNIKNSKSSFSFGFNFFTLNPTVRVTYRHTKFAGLEYSKAFSIDEIRPLMKEFIKKIKSDDFSLDGFDKTITEHFGIQSSHVFSEEIIKKMFNSYSSEIIAATTDMKIFEAKIQRAKKVKDDVSELQLKYQAAQNNKSILLGEQLITTPYAVRKQVIKAFAA